MFILECKYCSIFLEVTDAIEWEAHVDSHYKTKNGKKTLDSSNIKKNGIDVLFKTEVSVEKCDCIVCCEDNKKNDITRKLQCGHIYHRKCIDKWIKQKWAEKKEPDCPMCRCKLKEQIL
jgi:response regulator of citrate/malate metabolism